MDLRCDFPLSSSLCSGVLLLRQLFRDPNGLPCAAALEAGAAHVILSILETHRVKAEVTSVVMSVLLQSRPTQERFVAAANEVHAPSTLVKIIEDARTALEKAGMTSGGAPTSTSTAAASDELTMETLVVDTTPAQATTVLSQAIVLLQKWCSVPLLARQIVPAGVAALSKLLTPGAGSLLSDADVGEAILQVLASCAASCPDVCGAMVDAGAMNAVRYLPQSDVIMDRVTAVTHALNLITALASAGPAAAMAVVNANGAGVCEGLAVHYAVRSGGLDANGKLIYSLCGQALRAVMTNSEPLRREQAVAEARARLEGEMPPLPDNADEKARKAARKKFAKSLAEVQREHEKEERKRNKEAMAQAYSATKRVQANAMMAAAQAGTAPNLPPAFTAADILEHRAGLVPLDLFPRDTIEQLVQPEGLQLGVWFLPGMHETGKAKIRKMAVSVSPDLKTLKYSYDSKHHKRTLDWTIDLASVGVERSGVAKDLGKRKLFGPSPKDSRGVCLDAPGDGHTLLHLEAGSAEEHVALLRVLSILCQYARARAGVTEPLPEVYVNLAQLFEADSLGSGGAVEAAQAATASEIAGKVGAEAPAVVDYK